MISYQQQIIDALQENVFTVTGHTVLEGFPDEKPTYPLIIVEERPSNQGISVDSQPRIVLNSYQIDIYCQNMTIGGTITLASNVALQLGLEVDTFLNETFNFNSVGESVRGVLGGDNNIATFRTRYRVITDQETGYLYR